MGPRCINIESKEYKELLANSGMSQASLNNAILRFQEDNKTDKFPDLSSLNQSRGDYRLMTAGRSKNTRLPYTDGQASFQGLATMAMPKSMTNFNLEATGQVMLENHETERLFNFYLKHENFGDDRLERFHQRIVDAFVKSQPKHRKRVVFISNDISKEDYKHLTGLEYDDPKNGFSNLGGIVPHGKRTVIVNVSNKNYMLTGIHELIHPLSSAAMANNKSIAKSFYRLFRHANKIWVHAYGDNNLPYALTNEKEFISEVFSKKWVYDKFIYADKLYADRNKSWLGELIEWISDVVSHFIGRGDEISSKRMSERLDIAFDKLMNGDFSHDKEHAEADLFEITTTNTTSSDKASFDSAFQQFNNNITFVANPHEYIWNPTGDKMMPVSTVKKMMQYEDGMENIPKSLRASLAAGMGAAVHAEFESVITGKPNNDNSAKLTKEAKQDIKNIIEKLLPPGTQILGTEQVIGYEPRMIAGTLDLLVKMPDGKIVLIDFKSKITKASFLREDQKNPWLGYERGYADPKTGVIGKSQKAKFDFQQTMYMKMMEQAGLKINEKGIVPIELYLIEDATTPSGYAIRGVNVTKAIKTDNNGFAKLPNNPVVIKDVNAAMGIQGDMSKESQIKRQEALRLQEAAVKALNLLKKRSARYLEVGKKIPGEILEKKVRELESLSDAEAIVGFVASAINELNPIVDSYNKLLSKEQTEGSANWNLRTLQSWHEYASAYSVLNDIQILIQEFPKSFDGIAGSTIRELSKLVDQAVIYRNTIIAALDTKGMPAWVKWISEYSEAVEGSFRLTAEKEFKESWQRTHKDEKWTSKQDEDMQAYIDKYVDNNRAAIEDQKEKFIRINAEVCSQDTNGFFAYTSSIFDSKDPIIGAMAKAYYEGMSEYRERYLHYYKRLVELTREFEKTHNAGSFSDNKVLYNYMIEEGPSGWKIVSKIPAQFEIDFKGVQMRVNENENMSNADKHKSISNWLNRYAPITDKRAYHNDIIDYYKSLLKAGKISQDEYNTLEYHQNIENGDSPKRLAAKGELSMEIVGEIYKARGRITWKHRVVDSRIYPNEKYDAIMKLSKNDISRRMYEFFVELGERGDMQVADRFKLENRLPGVSKSFAERLKAGESFLSATKEELGQEMFGLRPDDTGFGQSVVASEGNQRINFVPIYFTNTLTEKDQSFDLPTIFNEWFKSAMNYEMVTNMLPMLQFTQRVVNNRRVLEKDKNGKSIRNRLGDIWNKRNSDSARIDDYVEAKTNNLSKMLNSWMEQVIYDKKDTLEVTHSKLVKAFSKWTSLKVMGLNLYSMINNGLMAETAQLVEAAAGTIATPKSYLKAGVEYGKHMPSILGDIGSRMPTSKVNLLNEHFGVFLEAGEGKLRDRTKLKRLFYQSALFFTTQVGEHMMQSKFLMASLMDIEAKNNNGESLGSVYDNYTAVDGILTLNPAVANFGEAEQMKVRRKVTQALRQMHGNYANYSRVMLQQNGYFSLALQFRKWIVPGIERRYRQEYFDEFSGQYAEGYYRSGFNYLAANFYLARYNVMKFFGKLADETKAFEIEAKASYRSLPAFKQAGIRRASADLAMVAILSLILWAIDDDDDDEKKVDSFYGGSSKSKKTAADFYKSHVFYQLYRLRTEQLFYINPTDFAKIVKSPIPATSTLTDVSELLWLTAQPWTWNDTYKTGPNKGRNKYINKVYKQLPVVRQVIRTMDPDSQMKSLQVIF